MQITDTIVAIATPVGNGGLGVLRVSGPAAETVLRRLFRSEIQPVERPRELVFGSVLDEQGRLLDRALAVWFPAPHSYTGEDVAELHCHGSSRLLREALRLALAAGARPAERGEFTERAFLNGQLDLAQAEAVLALIEARTADSLRLAATQLAGGLTAKIKTYTTRINRLLAEITVAVDFPDDSDVPDNTRLIVELEALLKELRQLLAGARRGRWLREGYMVTIGGPVNAGKSSLFNALLERERAIVTAEPGATRDALEDRWELEGLPLSLWDTAGFRPGAEQEAERLGMERSRQAIGQAALLLLVLDGTVSWPEQATELLLRSATQPRLLIINKADIAETEQLQQILEQLVQLAPGEQPLIISAKRGSGLEELRQAIRQALMGEAGEAEPPLLSEARHEEAINGAALALEQALTSLKQGWPADLAAIDLENALLCLSRITGEQVSEALLAEIFSRFCVGK